MSNSKMTSDKKIIYESDESNSGPIDKDNNVKMINNEEK